MRKTIGADDFKIWSDLSHAKPSVNVREFISQRFQTDPSLVGMRHEWEYGAYRTYFFPPEELSNSVLIGFFTTMESFEIEIQ